MFICIESITIKHSNKAFHASKKTLLNENFTTLLYVCEGRNMPLICNFGTKCILLDILDE